MAVVGFVGVEPGGVGGELDFYAPGDEGVQVEIALAAKAGGIALRRPGRFPHAWAARFSE